MWFEGGCVGRCQSAICDSYERWRHFAFSLVSSQKRAQIRTEGTDQYQCDRCHLARQNLNDKVPFLSGARRRFCTCLTFVPHYAPCGTRNNCSSETQSVPIHSIFIIILYRFCTTSAQLRDRINSLKLNISSCPSVQIKHIHKIYYSRLITPSLI